ncbi:MAG: hypothetical protein HF308_19915 [Ignavibacteria bacterium]|jgi:hypothetical protein|nr:hypothetical protein [Ignavibacteria bacterium]
MKHKSLFFILLIALVLLSGCIEQKEESPINQYTQTPVIGNLSQHALLLSDLHNNTISYDQRGSVKFLLLKNDIVKTGYHNIRSENGLIVCQLGSLNYILDKSGNALHIVPDEWNDERRQFYDELIKRETREYDKNMLIKERDETTNGYQKIVIKNNKVYGELGSREAYIGYIN